MNVCRYAPLVAVFFLILANLGWSGSFRNKFISFETPPNWGCQQEELDWVCQPDNPNIRNEAIVVVVTKAVNPTDDTLAKYEEYLKSPKQMRDLVGNSYASQVKYVKQKKIRDTLWVDSLQVGSEVPGFTSRYVAAIKEQVAGMISYHIADSVYSKWAEPLDKMIETAEMRFDPKAFDDLMKKPNTGMFQRPKTNNVGFTQPKDLGDADATKKSAGDDGLLMKILAAALIVGAIGFYIYKKRQRQG